MLKYIFINILCLTLLSCSSSGPGYQEPYDPNKGETDDIEKLSDDEIMNFVQEETFKYFWNYANKESGAARERYHSATPTLNENVVTTGGSGFGLMAIIVGVERGFVTKEEGFNRLKKIVSFFESADRFHGVWPHWLDGTTGKTIPFSPQDNGGDLVETAFLAQGLICVKEYYKNGNSDEQTLSDKADELWKQIEWNWYTQGENVLYWHWSPDQGFSINLKLTGYNETMIAYVLAAASPNYPISKNVYNEGWASLGAIKSNQTQYGFPLVLKHAAGGSLGGPLFFSHYSFLGLNPKNLSDQYGNYWDLAVNHTKINRQYCISNPNNYVGYGENCWGLTASYSRNTDGTTGYAAHSPTHDYGVISPTAAISSIVYTPKESLEVMHYMYQHKNKLIGVAGFYDAFSPHYDFWVAKNYLAIDQGPQIIMIENYRTGLLWDLFMQNNDVQKGLDILNFSY